MGKSKQKHRKQFIPVPHTLDQFVCVISSKENRDLLNKMYSKKSSCPRVLNSKVDCKPDMATMMRAVMCRTWYKVPSVQQKEMLVNTFRRNLKEAWAQYHLACRR